MTIFGRQRRVPSSKKISAQQKLRRKEFQRRALWGEALEARVVMDAAAGEFITHPYWNFNRPIDVDNDGMITAFDALRIVNELNANGARSLAEVGASGGEEQPGPETTGYLDVNNDNYVSALDALTVINRLNDPSAGEGEPMIQMTVQIVAAGTNNQIDTITKGGFYEVRVLAQDLGVTTFMGQTRNLATNSGVATTFFDLVYDTSKTDFQTSESQSIEIDGNPTDGGTFTLTVNDGGTLKTTAPITFNASDVTVTRNNIQNALNTLLKTTPTSANVVEVTDEVFGFTFNSWRVRFINRMSGINVPEMTANITGLGTATIAINELFDGTINPDSVDDALTVRTFFDANGNSLSGTIQPFYQNQRNGDIATFGINDVGGSNLQAPFPRLIPREIVRLRMTADDAGLVNINLSYADVNAALPTGLLGFSNRIPTDPLAGLVLTTNDSITIVEALSAGDDTVNLTENATAAVDINVTANDVNNAPTPNTTKTVQTVSTPTVGSAQILNGSTIRYTPPGTDFNGPATFTYTVTDQNGNSDTATVTVNFAAVNDAPVISTVAPQTFNEDTTRVFSSLNGNQITITDVDAAPGTVTVTLSVGAGNGTLTFASLAGLTGVTNNASTITATGTLGDLDLALNGLSYTPTLNLSGPVTLAITANDNGNSGGTPEQSSRNISLNITAVNDAPVVELGGFTITPDVVEGDPLVLNSTNNTLIQVSDVDAGTNSVVVTLAVTAGNLLHVNPTAGVVIGTNDTNNVTLTGTLTAINTALNGITYTPSATFGGNDESLTITINDQGNTGTGGAQSDTESVTITVDTSTRPRARNDAATLAEDSVGGVTIDVLYGVNPDVVNIGATPELLTFQTTSLNGGTITRDDNLTPADFSDDKLIYVPAPNFFGTDTFTYTMNDDSGLGADSTGTVTVTVTPVNDAPTAQNDPLSSIAEDSGARIILASDLIANDSRGDIGDTNESGQTLTIASVTAVTGGTVSINGSGNVVFTPTADFNGPASFTYTVQDNGTSGSPATADPKTSNSATVSFTITEVNDGPTAGNITLADIAEDSGTYVIPISTLLAAVSPGPANESGQMLTLNSVLVPNGGTVAIVGSNVEFTPTANFNGPSAQRFIIEVFDNGTTNGAPAPANFTTGVFFAITPVNDAPVAQPDTAQTGEGQAINVSVLANDRDVDVNPPTGTAGQVESGTTINIISQTPAPAVSGMVSIVGGNQIRFVPATGFFGQVVIEYQLDDTRGGLSNITTLTIDVVEANDPPVAQPDPGVVVNEDSMVSIDVFGNDTDPDTANTLWSFHLVSGPSNGDVVFNTTTRQVEYTPDPNYNGPDSFVYRINDNSPINPQSQFSGNALVSITVREVNDAPVGGVDPATGEITVIMDGDITFTTAQLLANDSPGLPANESGQTLSITAVTPTSDEGGTVTLVGGVITYTPAIGFTGNDFFEYTLTDNGTTAGAADPQSVQVRVNLVVRDFVPTDVIGRVFRDVNANGTFEANIDLPISGAEVTLSGTSLITNAAITPITRETNANGLYQFLAVDPGSYTLHETQPFGVADGIDTVGLYGTLAANDTIDLVLPLINLTGAPSIHDFAEGPLTNAGLVNSAGLAVELNGSSSPNGYILGTDLLGNTIWSWALKTWEGALSISVDLNDADHTMARLTVTDSLGSRSIDIFQNPHDTRNPNRLNADPVARLARFRILGWDANGNYLIRIDGKASDFFGTPLAAAPVMSGGEYVEGVDAAMAEESWV